MKLRARVIAVLLALLPIGGCSLRELAAGIVSDSLSAGGDVYAGDDDPDLVREALPFGLKTYEALLGATPQDRGILTSLAKGYTAYAYLLQDEADRAELRDHAGAVALRARASRLYLRARDYALRGLTVDHPGFAEKIRGDARMAAIAQIQASHVELLYWGAASWAGAVATNPNDLTLVAELPIPGLMMERVLALDEGYGRGAAHEFFVSFEGARPGGSLEAARRHYERALALSGGARASVYVGYAESVVVREQDLAKFRSLLASALAIDPDKEPSDRLANAISQRRARWLQAREPELFVGADQEGGTS